jgi:hypothetical protein
MTDFCLVAVRQITKEGQLDVDLTQLPAVPQAELQMAAAHLMRTEGAGHVLVLRQVVPLPELLAWFRAHKPIKDHPAVAGIFEAAS